MGTLGNPETSVTINLRCITSQKREYRNQTWIRNIQFKNLLIQEIKYAYRRKDGEIHVTSLPVLTILPLPLGAALRVTVLIEIVAFYAVATGTSVLLIRVGGVMVRFLLWWRRRSFPGNGGGVLQVCSLVSELPGSCGFILMVVNTLTSLSSTSAAFSPTAIRIAARCLQKSGVKQGDACCGTLLGNCRRVWHNRQLLQITL